MKQVFGRFAVGAGIGGVNDDRSHKWQISFLIPWHQVDFSIKRVLWDQRI